MWEAMDTNLAREYLSRDRWRVPFLERAVAEIERLQVETQEAKSEANDYRDAFHRAERNRIITAREAHMQHCRDQERTAYWMGEAERLAKAVCDLRAGTQDEPPF